MLILGIETSCDETSAAVVDDGRLVRSNVVASQFAQHAVFGGVVPEIASRQHVRAITSVVALALREANVEPAELDAVAATHGPGLAGALLVGVNFGRGYALGLGLPFLPVNHMEGHLYSVWLTDPSNPGPVPGFPVVSLIVSGGHTELILMRSHGHYAYLGRTLDDAAGEAFDKVARLLGLPYPGGPAIQRAAEGAADPLRLPRAWLPGTFDFSFSGLKTAVLHAAFTLSTGRSPDELRGQRLPKIDIAENLLPEQIANVAAGFQESVVDILVTKTVRAAEEYHAASVAVVGGVAANRQLRERMIERCCESETRWPLFIAPLPYSTDNAAMIAAAAYFAPNQSKRVDILPGLELTEDSA